MGIYCVSTARDWTWQIFTKKLAQIFTKTLDQIFTKTLDQIFTKRLPQYLHNFIPKNANQKELATITKTITIIATITITITVTIIVTITISGASLVCLVLTVLCCHAVLCFAFGERYLKSIQCIQVVPLIQFNPFIL